MPNYEFEYRMEDGSILWVYCDYTFFRDPIDNQIDEFIMTITKYKNDLDYKGVEVTAKDIGQHLWDELEDEAISRIYDELEGRYG